MHHADHRGGQGGEFLHRRVEQFEHGADVLGQALAVLDELADVATAAEARSPGGEHDDTHTSLGNVLDRFGERRAERQADRVAIVRTVEGDAADAVFDAVKDLGFGVQVGYSWKNGSPDSPGSGLDQFTRCTAGKR
ncbi:hypothetical protein D9M71_691930 [compost metagenome]